MHYCCVFLCGHYTWQPNISYSRMANKHLDAKGPYIQMFASGDNSVINSNDQLCILITKQTIQIVWFKIFIQLKLIFTLQ